MPSTFRTVYPYSFSSLQKEWEQCKQTIGQKQAEVLYKKTLLPSAKPVLLSLSITTKCNLSCLYCYYKEHGNAPFTQRELSIDALTEILSAIPHIQNLIFTLEGEPFLHSDFYALLKAASRFTKQITLVTNANMPLTAKLENLQDTNVKHIIVSVDSPHAGEYSTLRKGADFSLCYTNIQRLKSYVQTIQLHSVICRQNKKHVILLPYLAKDLGVSSISFSQLRETNFTRKNNIFPLSQKELKKVVLELAEHAKKTQTLLLFDEHFASCSFLQWIEKMHNSCCHVQLPHKKMCSTIWNYTGIISDTAIFPCCGDFSPEKLTAVSFDGIFNHNYLRILRALWLAKAPPQACKTCLFLT